jgi:PucR family transcriptional regulator, purine catabolism regulatory protein
MATAGPPTGAPDRAGPVGEPAGPGGEAAALRKLVAICSHLSALASQADGLTPVVEVLAERTGSGVAVVDRRLEVLAWAGAAAAGEITGVLRGDARQSTLRTVLAAAARTRRALAVPGAQDGRPVIVVAPVFVGEEVAGYLLARSLRDLGFTEDMRLLATEHGAMVCGIVLGRDLVVTAAAGRARQELVDGLLLSRGRDDPEVQRWARHLGLDPTREHFVMSFEIPGRRPDAAASPAELLMSRNVPDAVLASRTDEVVAILPVSGNGTAPAEQGRGLARACLAGAGPARVIAVGIGTPSPDAAGIARSYAEARRAVAAARRMGEPGTVTAFADLGIHRLLLRVPEVGDLRSFADEVLGRLAGEQRATGIDYLATLAAYFRENASPARAGRRLHVHPNTVSYRIRRVEELTGLSFSLHRDRLMAEVAVEILEGPGRPS